MFGNHALIYIIYILILQKEHNKTTIACQIESTIPRLYFLKNLQTIWTIVYFNK